MVLIHSKLDHTTSLMKHLEFDKIKTLFSTFRLFDVFVIHKVYDKCNEWEYLYLLESNFTAEENFSKIHIFVITNGVSKKISTVLQLLG